CATALEGLDDDHAAAAARARVREGLRFVVVDVASIAGLALCRRHVEEPARSRNVLGAAAVGQETVVADAMESVGQYVNEEATDELVDGERHQLGALAFLRSIVLPLEGHAGIVERDEPAVGDGVTVGVARQVSQYRLGPAEVPLSIEVQLGIA